MRALRGPKLTLRLPQLPPAERPAAALETHPSSGPNRRCNNSWLVDRTHRLWIASETKSDSTICQSFHHIHDPSISDNVKLEAGNKHRLPRPLERGWARWVA